MWPTKEHDLCGDTRVHHCLRSKETHTTYGVLVLKSVTAIYLECIYLHDEHLAFWLKRSSSEHEIAGTKFQQQLR